MIICLCGSTRFKEEFEKVNQQLTLEGHIVLSCGVWKKPEGEPDWSECVKDKLDELHLRKIELAEEIYIVNVFGYIGSSTRREIRYALEIGKKISFLESYIHSDRDLLNKELEEWKRKKNTEYYVYPDKNKSEEAGAVRVINEHTYDLEKKKVKASDTYEVNSGSIETQFDIWLRYGRERKFIKDKPLGNYISQAFLESLATDTKAK